MGEDVIIMTHAPGYFAPVFESLLKMRKKKPTHFHKNTENMF